MPGRDHGGGGLGIARAPFPVFDLVGPLVHLRQKGRGQGVERLTGRFQRRVGVGGPPLQSDQPIEGVHQFLMHLLIGSEAVRHRQTVTQAREVAK